MHFNSDFFHRNAPGHKSQLEAPQAVVNGSPEGGSIYKKLVMSVTGQLVTTL